MQIQDMMSIGQMFMKKKPPYTCAMAQMSRNFCQSNLTIKIRKVLSYHLIDICEKKVRLFDVTRKSCLFNPKKKKTKIIQEIHGCFVILTTNFKIGPVHLIWLKWFRTFNIFAWVKWSCFFSTRVCSLCKQRAYFDIVFCWL